MNKLEKFAALEQMPNVFQNKSFHQPQLHNLGQIVNLKGKWHSDFFKNQNPIVLELACGRGEYTVNLAKRSPNQNFIGIDLKGNRIYTGAKQSLDSSLSNVAFIRTSIEQLHHFLAPNEIHEIWITFPDPFPRFPDRKRRLISPRFLDYYRTHLAPNPIIYHLKTDNIRLFRYCIGVLDGRNFKIHQCIENLYESNQKIDEILKIKTYYEKLHQDLGSAIHYVRWEM